MLSIIAPVGALLLAVAFLLMGNGLQSTLLPVRAQIESFSTLSIGIMGSAYYVGFALGCLYCPHVVRAVGHIRAFTAMVAVASTVALLHILFLAPAVWWPLRGLTGFCFAGLYLVIESWLNDRATNQTRGTIIGIYTFVNLTVITVGQFMITLYDPAGFALFALASILVSLAAVPLALTRSSAPTPVAVVRLRPKHLVASSGLPTAHSFHSGRFTRRGAVSISPAWPPTWVLPCWAALWRNGRSAACRTVATGAR